MNRPDQKFRKRFAVLVTGGVLVAALFPMAGSVLAAVPTVPTGLTLAPASDSGTAGDNITNDTTPTITGSREAATTVSLFANGTPKGSDAGAGTSWSIDATPALTEGTYSFTATASNVDGTSGSSAPLSITILTPPTVTVKPATAQANPTSTSPVNFTVVFSHAVTNFVASDVTLSASTAGGTLIPTLTGSGSTYNVAVTGMTTAGTVFASVAAGLATDVAGNTNQASANSDNSVVWDPTLGPTVTINQASGQADPTATTPINFTVVFSAAVTGFDGTDVTLSGTAGATTTTVTGSGTTYNVAVSGMTANGTVIATIAADRALSTVGSHPNHASTSTDNSVTFAFGNKFLVTSSSYTPVPGGAVTISAQLATAAGVAVATSGVVVTWSSTNGGTFSSATSTTNASGIATVTFTVSSTSGTVHTVIATGGGFTGTSSNITVGANTAAVITITTSAPMPPGAHDPVITWGQGFTLGIQFAASGSGKTVALQGTRDGTTWTTITSLTMASSGGTTYYYTPVTNLWYRAVFAGTADLGAATSNQVRTVVRQIAIMRPTNFGHVRTISHNTSVTFTTTVRPARPELAPATVSFWFYRQSGGSWVLAAKRDVLIDAAGLARTTFTFTSSGQWYVRSAANPTPYNANSVMSPVERYSVL